MRGAAAIVAASLLASSLLAQDRPAPAYGLKREIYAGRRFDVLVDDGVDPNIESNWGEATPLEGVPADSFSIRWSGWIKPPREGRYKLYAIVDDGIRLWIDGEKVMDRFVVGSRVTDCSVEFKDEPHEIRVEYFEAGGPAYVALLWQHIDSPHMGVVPREVLFRDEASAKMKSTKSSLPRTGLAAEYFDKAFRRKFGTGTAGRTELIWGEGAPLWETPTDLCARYNGFLVPPKTGKYKFTCLADDSLRLWIDEKPVIQAGGRKLETAYVDLTANEPVPIKIEFVDQKGWASYYLHWTVPDSLVEVSLPADRLFQTKAAAKKAGE